MIDQKKIDKLRKTKEDWEKKIEKISILNSRVDPLSFIGKSNTNWLKKANKALAELEFQIQKMEMQQA